MGNFYNPVYFVTSASYSASSGLILTINGTPSMSEHSKFVIRFAPNVSVPSGVPADAPISISVGGTVYAMKDKYGEPLKFSELPLSRINNSYFSSRLAVVGGVGSEASGETTTYYYITFNLPAPIL